MTSQPQPLDPQGSQPAPGVSPRPPLPLIAWVYLALSLAGAILPWLANWDYVQSYGASFDLGQFLSLANANPASQSLVRDLGVAATAVTLWMVVEGRRLKIRGLVWVLLSCFAIDFAFAAPLFLHLRERRLAELAHQEQAATVQAAPS